MKTEAQVDLVGMALDAPGSQSQHLASWSLVRLEKFGDE